MRSLSDMKGACITREIEVVVQVARAPRDLVKALRPGVQFHDFGEPWHGVRRYIIQPRPPVAPAQKIYSPPLLINKNPNTSAPETLYNFLRWGMSQFPARRYMVVLSGHGAGFFGALTDYTHGHPYIMGIPGMAGALSSASRDTGKKIDLLALDTCYMNMAEVLYELSLTRAAAQLLVPVSAAPAEGFPYKIMLELLCGRAAEKDVRKIAAEIAGAINQNWQDRFRVCPVDLNPRYYKRIKRAAGMLATWEEIFLKSGSRNNEADYLFRWKSVLGGLIKNELEKHLKKTLNAALIPPPIKDPSGFGERLKNMFLVRCKEPGTPCLTLYTPEDVEEYKCFSRYYEPLLFAEDNLWVNKISGRPLSAPGASFITPLIKIFSSKAQKKYSFVESKTPRILPGPQSIPKGLLINSLVDLNPGYTADYFRQIINGTGWYRPSI